MAVLRTAGEYHSGGGDGGSKPRRGAHGGSGSGRGGGVQWSAGSGRSSSSSRGALLPGCEFTVALQVLDQFGQPMESDESTQVGGCVRACLCARVCLSKSESERQRDRDRESECKIPTHSLASLAPEQWPWEMIGCKRTHGATDVYALSPASPHSEQWRVGLQLRTRE